MLSCSVLVCHLVKSNVLPLFCSFSCFTLNSWWASDLDKKFILLIIWNSFSMINSLKERTSEINLFCSGGGKRIALTKTCWRKFSICILCNSLKYNPIYFSCHCILMLWFEMMVRCHLCELCSVLWLIAHFSSHVMAVLVLLLCAHCYGATFFKTEKFPLYYKWSTESATAGTIPQTLYKSIWFTLSINW